MTIARTRTRRRPFITADGRCAARAGAGACAPTRTYATQDSSRSRYHRTAPRRRVCGETLPAGDTHLRSGSGSESVRVVCGVPCIAVILFLREAQLAVVAALPRPAFSTRVRSSSDLLICPVMSVAREPCYPYRHTSLATHKKRWRWYLRLLR
jgi:hypothetical protein